MPRLPWSNHNAGSDPADPDSAPARAERAGRASAAAADVTPTTAVPLDPTAAAFFDVDNTMMVGASIFHFAKGLASRKFFTWRDLTTMAWQVMKFRVLGKENTSDIHSIRDNALSFVHGVDVDEIIRLGEEIYDELMADRIYAGTRALAQMHVEAGQRVWLITATPVELAQIIAHRLGLTGALGTVAEIVDGSYTGRLVGEMMHGEAKAVAVRALAEREGLDLSRCAAYSDSINDLPMLRLVGRPVAVNPDSDLRAVARQEGWEIEDYRTGRRAARIGVPTTLAAGALAGAVAGGLAVRRKYVQRVRAEHEAAVRARRAVWRLRRAANAANAAGIRLADGAAAGEVGAGRRGR